MGQYEQQRQEAARWARDLLALDRFFIFDTETTDIGSEAEIVQIGLIDQTGAVHLDSLVRPTVPISRDAQAIHGISAARVADAPGYADLHARLGALLQDQVVVAYNADFDRRILRQTCTRYGLTPVRVGAWHCAMLWYAQFYGVWNPSRASFKWQRLGDACAQQGIPAQGAHAAVADCRLTLALIRKMAGV